MNTNVKSVGVKDVDQSDFVVALSAFLKKWVPFHVLNIALYHTVYHVSFCYWFSLIDPESCECPNGATLSRPPSTRNLPPMTRIGSTPDAPRLLDTFTTVSQLVCYIFAKFCTKLYFIYLFFSGVGALTKIYGGRYRRGVRPSHFARGGTNVARKALQSLEGMLTSKFKLVRFIRQHISPSNSNQLGWEGCQQRWPSTYEPGL